MAVDALAAQERLTRRESPSAIARRTVGRDRRDREVPVPKVLRFPDWILISATHHSCHPD